MNAYLLIPLRIDIQKLFKQYWTSNITRTFFSKSLDKEITLITTSSNSLDDKWSSLLSIQKTLLFETNSYTRMLRTGKIENSYTLKQENSFALRFVLNLESKVSGIM